MPFRDKKQNEQTHAPLGKRAWQFKQRTTQADDTRETEHCPDVTTRAWTYGAARVRTNVMLALDTI